MDYAWRAVERLLVALERNATTVLAAFGIGLVRVIHGWVLGEGRAADLPVDYHLLIDLGEIVAFAAYAWIAHKFGPMSKRSWPVGVGLFCLTVALATTGPAPWSGNGAVASVGYVCEGVAYAALFLVWLEACGCIDPICAVLAIAGSYLVALLGWLALEHVDALSTLPIVATAGALTALLLVLTYRQIPQTSLPRASVATHDNRERAVLSVRMLAWVALVSLVFGFGDCFTKMGYSTLFSKLGNVVPLVVIAVCLRFMRGGFDLRTLYRASLVLVGAGVIPTVLFDVLPDVSQVLLSAALASNLIAACAFACTSARRRHESAVFGCGVLLIIALVATLLGNAMGDAFIEAGFAYSEPMARVAGTLAVAATVFLAAFIMRDVDLSSLVGPARWHGGARTSEQRAALSDVDAANGRGASERSDEMRSAFASILGEGSSVQSALGRLASKAGMSKRETAVFLLMAEGKSTAQIGDELFIAPGTVRAHMSRIYEKLGVHSREEFGELLGL